jgi:hypothetical protein
MSTFKIYILATTLLSPSVTLTSQFSPYLFPPRKIFLLVEYVPGYKLPVHIHAQRSTVVLDSGYSQSSYTEALRQVFTLARCPTVRDQDDKQWESTLLSCAPQFFKFPMILPLQLLIKVILRRRWECGTDRMILTGETRSKQRDPCARVTASTKKLTLKVRVSNTGLLDGDRPVIKSLSHDTSKLYTKAE